jgi:hypothetical protein
VKETIELIAPLRDADTKTGVFQVFVETRDLRFEEMTRRAERAGREDPGAFSRGGFCTVSLGERIQQRQAALDALPAVEGEETMEQPRQRSDVVDEEEEEEEEEEEDDGAAGGGADEGASVHSGAGESERDSADVAPSPTTSPCPGAGGGGGAAVPTPSRAAASPRRPAPPPQGELRSAVRGAPAFVAPAAAAAAVAPHVGTHAMSMSSVARTWGAAAAAPASESPLGWDAESDAAPPVQPAATAPAVAHAVGFEGVDAVDPLSQSSVIDLVDSDCARDARFGRRAS